MSLSKKAKAIKAKKSEGAYSFADGVELLKDFKAKFDESVDIALRLGINPSRDSVRCAVSLPHGTGRSVSVLVVTKDGDSQKAALAAGAKLAGAEEAIAELKENVDAYDVVIASPDSMAMLAPLARTLGPKGLMPNPKLGTVTTDVAKAVKDSVGGQAVFRTDKQGIVHTTIGRMSLTTEQLKENMQAVLSAVYAAKPEKAKGVYMKKLCLSSTMGPGFPLSDDEFRKS